MKEVEERSVDDAGLETWKTGVGASEHRSWRLGASEHRSWSVGTPDWRLGRPELEPWNTELESREWEILED